MEYLRAEQMHHANQKKDTWLNAEALKRVLMVAISVGFLAAAIHLST